MFNCAFCRKNGAKRSGAVHKKNSILLFTLLFFLSLHNSCTNQSDSEKSPAHVVTGTAVGNPAQFDSLALADSLFARGEYFYKQEINDSSIYYHQRAGEIYKNLTIEDSLKWSKVVSVLTMIGETYWRKGNADSALYYLNRALFIGIPKFGSSSREVAHIYHDIGNVYMMLLSELDSAFTFYNKALELRKAIYGSSSIKTAQTLGNISNLFFLQSNYNKALNTQKKIHSIFRKHLDEQHYYIGMNFHNMALNLEALGRIDEAIEKLNETIVIYRKHLRPDHPGIANTYNSFGNLYFKKGFYDEAYEYYKKAEAIYSRHGAEYWYIVSTLLTNIGHILTIQSDYEKAKEYFEKAISTVLMHQDNVLELVQPYKHLSEILIREKNYIQAENYLEKVLSIQMDNHSDDHLDIAWTNVLIGDLFLKKGDLGQAEIYFQKGLQSLVNVLGEEHRDLVQLYSALSEMYLYKNDIREALKYNYKAQFVAKQEMGDKHPELSKAYKERGDIYLVKDQYIKALKFYHKSIIAVLPNFFNYDLFSNPSRYNTLSYPVLLQAMTAKVKCLLILKDNLEVKKNKLNKDIVDSSIEAGLQYIYALIDSMRIGYQTKDAKLDLVAETKELYEIGLQVVMGFSKNRNTKYRNYVFALFERSKSVVFQESVNNTFYFKVRGIADSLLIKEYNYRRELNYLDIELHKIPLYSTDVDSMKLVNMKNRLFGVRRKYEKLIKQIETDYPEFYKLKYDTKVATVEEVQAALDDDTVLLEYFYGDSAIYAFVLDKDSLEIVSFKKDRQLEQDILTLRDATIKSDYARFVEKSRLLYRTLLEPVARHLEGKHLLIIPDGPLNYLPFETLLIRDADDRKRDFSSLPYLVTEHPVSYHYSATLWLETTLRKRQKQPIYDYVAFAPVNWDSTVASNAAFEMLAANQALDSTRSLPLSLSSTRDEVLEVEALFNRKYNLFAGLMNRLISNRTRVFLGKEATEVAAKNYNLRDYRYIHFATHGFANTSAPILSGLLLADRKENEAAEDGVLRLGEVYNLELNADLVVLSACETGYGKLARGEGLLSLTRGFIYAGARNLVVSLWQVDANSPSDLTPRFFAKILTGASNRNALRDAKMELIASGTAYAEPRHWAPFVLIGQ